MKEYLKQKQQEEKRLQRLADKARKQYIKYKETWLENYEKTNVCYKPRNISF